jgi:hypothetical protein
LINHNPDDNVVIRLIYQDDAVVKQISDKERTDI